MKKTSHYFLPSVREGLSASMVPAASGQQRASVDVKVDLAARVAGTGGYDNRSVDAPPIHLYGPGDVTHFDARVVARTSPEPDVGDFEPNYFPHIEFADPDFAWRFTATDAHDTGSVQPWITLIVLVAEDGGGLDPEFVPEPHSERSLPPRIRVTEPNALPDLQHARRWAHVHITGASSSGVDKPALLRTLREHPERAVCRLLCVRRLHPKVKYAAFVVPTFMLGRRAGLGQAFRDGDDARTPAWDKNQPEGGGIQLPYYYRWEFRTGRRGDFEHLVRLLEPRKLTGLGKRPVDCSRPGFRLPPVTRSDLAQDDPERHVLEAEGGLEALDTRYTRWGRDLGLRFTDPPGLDDIQVARTGERTIEVCFRSVEPALGSVEYGTGADALDQQASAPDAEHRTRSHRLQVGGLTLGQTYHLRIVARPANGPEIVTRTEAFELLETDPFQSELADLLNKPNTEDRTPRGFSFDSSATDSVGSISGAPLPTGDGVKIEVTWRSAVPKRARIECVRNGNVRESTVDLAPSASSHVLSLDRLIPGKEYAFKLHAQTDEGAAYAEVASGGFTMPPLPTVLPPVYGRWHRAKLRASEGDGKGPGAPLDAKNQREWLEALNLDPRHRLAAGLGASVVRTGQEPLMASAWDQLGAVRQVNEALGRAQLARDVGTRLHRRLGQLHPESFLRVTERAQRRITRASENGQGRSTAARYLHTRTRVPPAAMDPGFRRIASPKHSIFKRQSRAHSTLLNRQRRIATNLATARMAGAGASRQVLRTPRLENVDRQLLRQLGVESQADKPQPGGISSLFSGKVTTGAIEGAFAGDNDPFGRIDDPILKEQRMGMLEPTRKMLDAWLHKPQAPQPDTQQPEFLQGFKGEVADDLEPHRTVTTRAKRQLSRPGKLVSRFDPDTTGDPLDPVAWYPEFWQPMYEALREKSHALLLPGIEEIPNNTLGLLRPNRRFIEAYLAGCNHELAGELLWRGFPTDQRGTHFRQFWDVDEYVLRPSERRELLTEWLATHDAASVAELPLTGKQMLFAPDLDGAVELLREKLLAQAEADSESELEPRIQKYLKALQNDQLDALTGPNQPGALHQQWTNALEETLEELATNQALQQRLADIRPMTEWEDAGLGRNVDRPSERLILVIRGDLLKRYPGAVIYAVDAVPSDCASGPAVPALKEYLDCDDPDAASQVLSEKRPIFPTFRADFPSDLTLLGFPFDQEAACGGGADDERLGKYFVIEERISEPRFGLDTPAEKPPEIYPESWPNDLNWSHFGFMAGDDSSQPGYLDEPDGIADPLQNHPELLEQWQQASSAKRAQLTLQKPVRIAIHACNMVPDPPAEDSE